MRDMEQKRPIDQPTQQDDETGDINHKSRHGTPQNKPMDTCSIKSREQASESTQPDDAGAQGTVRPQPLPGPDPRGT
jgi:hypothetical protein